MFSLPIDSSIEFGIDWPSFLGGDSSMLSQYAFLLPRVGWGVGADEYMWPYLIQNHKYSV